MGKNMKFFSLFPVFCHGSSELINYQIEFLGTKIATYSCAGDEFLCSQFTKGTGRNDNEKDCACYGTMDFCAEMCTEENHGNDRLKNPKILTNESDDECYSNLGGFTGAETRKDQEGIMRSVIADCNRNNWDAGECAKKMREKLEKDLCCKNYNCSVAKNYYTYSGWAPYHACEDNYCAICGKKNRHDINKKKFEDNCDGCANLCAGAEQKAACVNSCMRNVNVYCTDSHPNFLISEYGQVGLSTYGGHLHASRYGNFLCAGYCIPN